MHLSNGLSDDKMNICLSFLTGIMQGQLLSYEEILEECLTNSSICGVVIGSIPKLGFNKGLFDCTIIRAGVIRQCFSVRVSGQQWMRSKYLRRLYFIYIYMYINTMF